jgi:hypothetical protein
MPYRRIALSAAACLIAAALFATISRIESTK